MKKSILDYMVDNTKKLDYVVSIQTKLSSNRLMKKELKISEINKFCNYLYKENISNEKIGILIENSNSFVKAFYGIGINNRIAVAVNPSISLEELNDIIEKNNLDTIIASDELKDKAFKSNISKVIEIDKIRLDKESDEIQFNTLNRKSSDVFVISYTSGTSGKFSKGVELTFENVTFVSEEYKKVYGLSKDSSIIAVLPFWHNFSMFACLTSSIVSCAKLVIMKEWDSQLFLKINDRLKPTVFPGSPYMYIDLINNNSDKLKKLTNLKVCDSGGDSLPIECIYRFEEATNAVITEGYGLTETTSLTHFNYSASQRQVGSLGKAVTNVECKILDSNGKEVNNGEWGILWIKGPMVFKDYVGLPEVSKSVRKNGWFDTGDIVKVDDNGFYYLAGRLSDLMEISDDDSKLRSLENSLYKYNGLKRVYVKSNYNSVEKFHFFDVVVELKSNYTIQDLYDFINLNLKGYVINSVTAVDKLPTTGTGKIKRNEVEKLIVKSK